MRAFRRISTNDTSLMLIQDQIGNAFSPLLRLPVLDHVEIKDLIITTSGLDIPHGLGRQPLGWVVTDINASATIWKTAWTGKLLSLDASGTATISILVY